MTVVVRSGDNRFDGRLRNALLVGGEAVHGELRVIEILAGEFD